MYFNIGIGFYLSIKLILIYSYIPRTILKCALYIK